VVGVLLIGGGVALDLMVGVTLFERRDFKEA